MEVLYEWAVEYTAAEDSAEYEAGEVIDVNHFDTYREALEYMRNNPEPGMYWQLVLVRDAVSGGNRSRSWAYVTDGKLPERFVDAYNDDAGKVPDRFVREMGR